MEKVYPRVRGGTRILTSIAASLSGLSPRARGNHSLNASRVQTVRSIPACAGEPDPAGVELDDGGVYPRVRGGTSAERCPTTKVAGLSHVRGGTTVARRNALNIGSIPACAKPRHPTPRGRDLRSIPACARPPSTIAGASRRRSIPRARGNRSVIIRRNPRRRSIPACAGEPSASWPLACSTRGLSPRARGNLLVGAKLLPIDRSIPACAGEPENAARVERDRGVYPRVRGGTAHETQKGTDRQGLSPRARGNPTKEGCRGLWRRSIPACAGEPRPTAAAQP